MADEQQASYKIDLEGNVSGAAASAAGALKGLREQLDADAKALANMQRAMKNLQGGTSVNIAQFRELKEKIDAKRQSIAQAQSSILSLGGSLDKTRRPGEGLKSMLEQFADKSKQLGGPLGNVTSSLGNLRSLVAGSGLVIGIAAVAAAFIAISVAAIAATAALVKYGIASANARRTELLRLEGLTKMRNWWGIAAGNAGEMQAAIDRVSDSSSIGRDKIAAYGTQLYKAGLRGTNFSEALEGAAIKAAVLGEEQASAFMGLATMANRSGGSVKRLADDVRARFGGIAAAMALDWDVQFDRLKKNFGSLFAGLNIEPLLKALSVFTGMFSQTQAIGRAFKSIFTAVFQPLIDSAGKAQPIIKRFFQGITIAALYVTIAFLKIRNYFRDAFPGSLINQAGLANAALAAGVIAAGALVLALSPLIGAMAAFGAYVSYIAVIQSQLWAAFGKGYEFVSNIDWAGLGTTIADGIVGGIKGAASAVTDAVSNLGQAAYDAFKSKLGIASPSKEFAKLGVNISQGVQQGVNAGAPGAQQAIGNMVDPSSGVRLMGGGGTTINFGDIVLSGVKKEDAAEIAGAFKRKLEEVLSTVAQQMGARVPG